MVDPVDLANLRSMTDGDVEMEHALFGEFFKAFDHGIAALQSSLAADAEEWRKTAHALKGISLNLGAMALGSYCTQAQNESTASASAKTALLEQMRSEYGRVHAFLRTVMEA